jgi:hypothetical protein
MRHIVALASAAVFLMHGGPGAAQTCAGDCGGDGEVTINELVRAVAVALGSTPVAECAAVDADGDGAVRVPELIVAVNNLLGGCGAAPATRTPTPTVAANATPTVGGPCRNGEVTFSYANASGDSNAVTSNLRLTLLAASQVRDARTGLYVWAITALECTEGVAFRRSIQIQIIGASSPFAAGQTIDLGSPTTFPLDLVVYGELQDPNAFLRTWTPSGGSLSIESAEGSRIRFHLVADMMPYPLNSFGDQPRGTFRLEVRGEITDVATS